MGKQWDNDWKNPLANSKSHHNYCRSDQLQPDRSRPILSVLGSLKGTNYAAQSRLVPHARPPVLLPQEASTTGTAGGVQGHRCTWKTRALHTLCLRSLNREPKYQRCFDWGSSLKLSIEEAKVFSRNLGKAPEAGLPPAAHTHLRKRGESKPTTQSDGDASHPIPPQSDLTGEITTTRAGRV